MHAVDGQWLRDAVEWIRRHAEPCGPLEERHATAWSTVLRVPTNEGDLWFKAVAPPHTFEPGATEILARVRPDVLPRVLAVDTDRGWLLMRDAGARLRDVVRPGADAMHWEQVLPLYAQLQIDASPFVEDLLAAGVPDARPDALCALLADVLEGGSHGLTPTEVERVRDAHYSGLCDELDAYGIPPTIQHDDLHDGQVYVRDGRYLFLDWGDSSVAHPFHSLVVTLRALAWKLDLAPGGRVLTRLRDAYLEPWARYGTGDELAAAATLAYRTGIVARALAWHRHVAARPPGERGEDADAVPYGLKLFLADGPIGTWAEPR